MSNLERFSLCVLFVMLIGLLVVVCVSWGHDTPGIQDGSQTHTLSKVRLDGRHWHEDSDGRGASGWQECVAAAYDKETNLYDLQDGQCAEPPPPPPSPPVKPLDQEHKPSNRTPPVNNCKPVNGCAPVRVAKNPDVPASTTPPTTIKTIEKVLDNAQSTISEDVVVPEPETPVIKIESCVEERVERLFYKGYTLYTPTVLPESVSTIAGLWERNSFTGANGGAFYVVVDTSWLVYRGSGDVGDIPLRPGIGILVYQETNGTLAGLRGCPVTSQVQIELQAGLNLIGFPVVPDTIERPSDLLSDSVHGVIITQTGQFKMVSRVGDDGDEPIVNGQGLLVLTSQPTTISLEPPQAPQAPRHGTLITKWGAMKQ